jgi:hypothetical protein
LKSFLFDTAGGGSGVDDEVVIEKYVEETLRALDHIVTKFPGLNLHDRLLIVTPDNEFNERLQSGLKQKLPSRFSSRRFTLKGAKEASAMVGASSATASEWIVLDTIANVDGLERLIVIGVGLDEQIENQNNSFREASPICDSEYYQKLMKTPEYQSWKRGKKCTVIRRGYNSSTELNKEYYVGVFLADTTGEKIVTEVDINGYEVPKPKNCSLRNQA